MVTSLAAVLLEAAQAASTATANTITHVNASARRNIRRFVGTAVSLPLRACGQTPPVPFPGAWVYRCRALRLSPRDVRSRLASELAPVPVCRAARHVRSHLCRRGRGH